MTIEWIRLIGLLMALSLAFAALRKNPFGWRKQLVMALVWGVIIVVSAIAFASFHR